jgi:xylulokinase
MIISHDLGTTGDKATLVSDDGRVLAAVTSTYATDFGPRGKAEQDAEAWWTAVCVATRELLARSGVGPADIEVVSFSGQMMGAVLLDGAGLPVRPAIIWADTRSVAQSAALVERVGMERGYLITGHRLNPTYSLSKIMWVRDHEPEVFARTRTVLLAKDFVCHRLTGVLVTDPSDASSTNAYDQAAGEWSGELIDAARLSRTLFPEIVASTTVVGGVTDEAARATGLLAGTPVVLGGGDGPMGALGAGVLGPESGAYAYLGSSSWVSVAADAPLHDPQMRSMTFNHVVPGRYVPTATMQAGGASLEWVIDTLAPGQDDRYPRLLAEAAQVQASEDGLYFLPHLLGERSPYWNPAARAVFAGLGRHHGPAHLTRAVLEGVAFNLYTGLLAFVENGTPIDAVDAIGGAANSALLLQVFADVWGVPVSRRNLVDEATAVGAAVVAGVGVGIFDDFTVAGRFSEELTTQAPDEVRHQRYGAEYALFMEAYRRLEPWFDKL